MAVDDGPRGVSGGGGIWTSTGTAGTMTVADEACGLAVGMLGGLLDVQAVVGGTVAMTDGMGTVTGGDVGAMTAHSHKDRWHVGTRETWGVCTKRGAEPAKGHGLARVQGRADGAGTVRAGMGAQEGASDAGRARTVARVP